MAFDGITHITSVEVEQEYGVNDFSNAYGYAPTVFEIADITGISKSTVQRYIAQMREDGIVTYSGHRNLQSAETRSKSVRVPVLRSIACGIPKFAEENIEEYVRLPESLFGTGDFFFLRANGDSMIEAGIDDGDLVLIRQQNTALPGQIVVALTDNDNATLKRFYPEPEKHIIRLHPENSTMEDIFVTDCVVQGVAVKVIKELEI